MTRDEEIDKIFDVIYQAKIDLQDFSTQNLASRLYHAGLRFERVIEWPEKKPKEEATAYDNPPKRIKTD